MCEICELKQRIEVLEARVAVLEQRPNYVPYVPNPLYPWHEKDTTAPVYPTYPTGPVYPVYPNTWCCARNTHDEDGT